MKKQIGFIGLGIMGAPMARRLLDAGYEVCVHNRSSEPVEELASLGAVAKHSPRQVAGGVDIVITMLPDSPEVRKVVLGADGIIEAARPELFYIDMSTVAPETTIEVHKQLETVGVRALDAPVSGGQIGAENGTLSIMVGGSVEVLEDVRPVLEVLGQTITHCGAAGAGQTVKACNQTQVALTLLGMAEALVFAAKAGVDPAIVLRVLGGGLAQTKIMDVRGPTAIRGSYDPGFKSKLHYKDLGIVMDAAEAMGLPLPGTALAQQLFAALLTAGHGELDHSAIVKIHERLGNVEIRTRQD